MDLDWSKIKWNTGEAEFNFNGRLHAALIQMKRLHQQVRKAGGFGMRGGPDL
jgi:hypothetical protein